MLSRSQEDFIRRYSDFPFETNIARNREQKQTSRIEVFLSNIDKVSDINQAHEDKSLVVDKGIIQALKDNNLLGKGFPNLSQHLLGQVEDF